LPLEQIEKLLVYPGVVAALTGVAAYLYRQVQKFRAIAALLESEINRLLANARENLDFLDRRSHYWLQTGHVLTTAPKAFSPQYKVFDAVISDLYILGRERASNILAFYEYHAFCENLRQSLFAHVADLKEAGEALTQKDVEVLNSRLERACLAYKTLESQYPNTVELRGLRSNYQIPSAQLILKALASSNER